MTNEAIVILSEMYSVEPNPGGKQYDEEYHIVDTPMSDMEINFDSTKPDSVQGSDDRAQEISRLKAEIAQCKLDCAKYEQRARKLALAGLEVCID